MTERKGDKVSDRAETGRSFIRNSAHLKKIPDFHTAGFELSLRAAEFVSTQVSTPLPARPAESTHSTGDTHIDVSQALSMKGARPQRETYKPERSGDYV